MNEYQIIHTAQHYTYFTGGILCNLAGKHTGKPVPDFLCGEIDNIDNPTPLLNWFHWSGDGWIRTVISDRYFVTVGMEAADITGNGKLDVIFGDWGDYRPTGDVYWAEQPENPFTEGWPIHKLATGCRTLHDMLVGDISGEGNPDVLIRNKHGRISWFSRPSNPRKLWEEIVVTEKQKGDGLALYDITGTGSPDIVTGTGFYENVDGKGRSWKFRSFGIDDLGMDPEGKVAAGDLLNDNTVTVVITESEVESCARIVLLHSADRGKSWSRKVLIDKNRDFRALHTLQISDVDGDGLSDIFTAEMEGYRSDWKPHRSRWMVFFNKGGLEFEEFSVLDANLGAHQACAGIVSGKNGMEFVGKEWLPNEGNSCGSRNHIVHVKKQIGL
ncbi:MAG: hypothetical protein Q7J78_03630 [Clostridiales bacterium]|nr:hypothetical protein [Clostridiales bacterium]